VGGWWYNTSGANQNASSVIQVPDKSVFDPNVESPWHVVDLPGKGKGAIAARDIQARVWFLVLTLSELTSLASARRDAPTGKAPPACPPHQSVFFSRMEVSSDDFMAVRVSPTDFIWDQVKVLSDDKKGAFFNLSYVGFPAGKDPAKDKKELALAIFETNAVAAGPHVGLFPRMARLNHGCSSAFNAVYSWRANEGVLVIHALKPIARGSVCFSHIR
jgi:hypothetical protein